MTTQVQETITFTAIYEDGVLRPLEPLDLPEHARVTVRVAKPQSAAVAQQSPEERQRRQDALRRIREIRDRVQAREPRIETEEEAMAIADRFVREVIDEMVAEGKIVFERQQ